MFHPQGPSFFELAVQALSSTERGYDLLAPKFDYTPFRTPDVLLQAVARQLAPLGPFGSALDLCCGTGAGMLTLLPMCQQRCVGIDFSRGMLRVCRERLAGTASRAAWHLVRGNALAMPFQAEFDLAVCFGALGHFVGLDQRRLVAEVARVLRPGGRFVFVTARHPSLWSRAYWFSRAFNAAMHIRNFLVSPPFIMYYLTFRLPEVNGLLKSCGLAVDVRELSDDPCYAGARLVVATKPTEGGANQPK